MHNEHRHVDTVYTTTTTQLQPCQTPLTSDHRGGYGTHQSGGMSIPYQRTTKTTSSYPRKDNRYPATSSNTAQNGDNPSTSFINHLPPPPPQSMQHSLTTSNHFHHFNSDSSTTTNRNPPTAKYGRHSDPGNASPSPRMEAYSQRQVPLDGN